MRVYIDVYLLQNGPPKDLMLDSLVSYFDMEMGMSYIQKFPGAEKRQSWIDLIYLFQVSASHCIVGTPTIHDSHYYSYFFREGQQGV